MKKNSVYLFLMLLNVSSISSASAAWKELITCDNGVSIATETSVPKKTQYKANIQNKNIIKNLGPTEASTNLELFDTSYYPPQSSRFTFSSKNQNTELKILKLDRGSLFSFEVISPQEITCLQEVCSSGCYAGDTAVWTCVDLRVTPESTLYSETAYCK